MDTFGVIPTIKETLQYMDTMFEVGLRRFLAALAMASDYRRGHPNPAISPFQGNKKPKNEQPIFVLGSPGYMGKKHYMVGVHEDGWITFIRTQLTARIEPSKNHRFMNFIAEWCPTELDYVTEGDQMDLRSILPLEGGEGKSGMDLYPVFLNRIRGTVGK